MQIVTTREFRANQKKYFEMAEKETIFVSRRNAAPIVVYAATEEDFPSREELRISRPDGLLKWERVNHWMTS